MHAPAPELRALRKLAEKYNAQFDKLLKAELDEIGASPVVDSEGKLFELEDKALTKDGARVTITRIDIKSKRVVVLHADGHKQLLMAHRLKKLPKNTKAGKADKTGDKAAASVVVPAQAEQVETEMTPSSEIPDDPKVVESAESDLVDA